MKLMVRYGKCFFFYIFLFKKFLKICNAKCISETHSSSNRVNINMNKYQFKLMCKFKYNTTNTKLIQHNTFCHLPALKRKKNILNFYLSLKVYVFRYYYEAYGF